MRPVISRFKPIYSLGRIKPERSGYGAKEGAEEEGHQDLFDTLVAQGGNQALGSWGAEGKPSVPIF